MKNLIKTTAITLTVMLLSAIILSAQEHNNKHGDKKDGHKHQTVDTKKIDKNNDGIIYECPMKCEEASDKAGECSKCGMDLKEISIKNSSSKKHSKHMNHETENHSSHSSIDKNGDGFVYECPMKCEDASDKAGECSKCGMNLKKVPTNDKAK